MSDPIGYDGSAAPEPRSLPHKRTIVMGRLAPLGGYKCQGCGAAMLGNTPGKCSACDPRCVECGASIDAKAVDRKCEKCSAPPVPRFVSCSTQPDCIVDVLRSPTILDNGHSYGGAFVCESVKTEYRDAIIRGLEEHAPAPRDADKIETRHSFDTIEAVNGDQYTVEKCTTPKCVVLKHVRPWGASDEVKGEVHIPFEIAEAICRQIGIAASIGKLEEWAEESGR